VLRLDSIQMAPGQEVQLTFTVPAYLSCTVLFNPGFAAGTWTPLTNYPAAPVNRVLQFATPASGESGFYRLRSP
jgi:hypothetical protein